VISVRSYISCGPVWLRYNSYCSAHCINQTHSNKAKLCYSRMLIKLLYLMFSYKI